MHELSIADAIVSIAARSAGGRRVAAVEVAVGELRQVVPGALELAFEVCAAGTLVEGAELRLARIPTRVACGRCGLESRVEPFPLRCPPCGALDVDVVSGEELYVEALELEEEANQIPSGRR
jgi:hydrogenase nickel incorporation protein HypA/HybF